MYEHLYYLRHIVAQLCGEEKSIGKVGQHDLNLFLLGRRIPPKIVPVYLSTIESYS